MRDPYRYIYVGMVLLIEIIIIGASVHYHLELKYFFKIILEFIYNLK